MSNETNKKEPMSVVKKMMIALVGGLGGPTYSAASSSFGVRPEFWLVK